MANTELFEMSNEERLKKIRSMETDLLFAELEDTVQYDMLGMSNHEWTCEFLMEQKVFRAIVRELGDRIRALEKQLEK